MSIPRVRISFEESRHFHQADYIQKPYKTTRGEFGQLRLIVAGYNLTPVPLPGIIPPELRNRGEHILRTGGKFDSHLLVPVVS